jgi:hypothetical protein
VHGVLVLCASTTRESDTYRQTSGITPGMTPSNHGYRWWREQHGLRLGESYPLKQSDLEAVLAAHPVGALHEVHLGRASSDQPAEFFKGRGFARAPRVDSDDWLPLVWVRWTGVDALPWSPSFSAGITIFAVPSTRRSVLRERMIWEIMPGALRWVRELERGPQTRRSERHQLVVYLERENLCMAEASGS